MMCLNCGTKRGTTDGLCAECYNTALDDIVGDLVADGMSVAQAEDLAMQQLHENESTWQALRAADAQAEAHESHRYGLL